MISFLKRLIYAFSNKIIKRLFYKDDSETRLVADFSKPAKKSIQHPFDIKSDSSYNAYICPAPAGSALALGIKKTNCIAFTDIPNCEYRDHIIDAKIRLDSLGGYASAGIIFRILNRDSYYMALISGKGYFRFDVIKDGSPRTLIAWTEVSEIKETASNKSDTYSIGLKIIAYGSYFIFVVNGVWLAEITDESIREGGLGFVAASYESESTKSGNNESSCEYTCIAYLDYFSVDARAKTMEKQFKKWTSDENINADTRLKLAETFAVMDKPAKAMEQINRAWHRRDTVIRSIATTYTEARTKKELLLAARMSFRLGQFKEALGFIESIIDQWPDSNECKFAYGEKIKILLELNDFAELKKFLQSNAKRLEKDTAYYSTLAHACWEIKDYKTSFKAWQDAYKLNRENGVYAANAANALEALGKKKEAAALFLEAGRIFLRQDNTGELDSLMPKLLFLDTENWEVHALAGKWHFSKEEYDTCEKEFARAERLRIDSKPRPKADPALYYLWGLVCYLKENRKDAVKFLEKAVKLAPDYELFREKLEEIKK